MNVLLIEDDQWQVRFIRQAFSRITSFKIQLEDVTRLKSALDVLARRPFDAILFDLQLPDSDGLDTFVTVRTAYPAIPIIVLTGMDDEALALEALRRGAQDYLVKSELQEAALVRSLRFAVERKRRERAEQLVSEVQERERKRLSRELHDGVIQSLSSVRLQLQMLASKTSRISVLKSRRSCSGQQRIAALTNHCHFSPRGSWKSSVSSPPATRANGSATNWASTSKQLTTTAACCATD